MPQAADEEGVGQEAGLKPPPAAAAKDSAPRCELEEYAAMVARQTVDEGVGGDAVHEGSREKDTVQAGCRIPADVGEVTLSWVSEAPGVRQPAVQHEDAQLFEACGPGAACSRVPDTALG